MRELSSDEIKTCGLNILIQVHQFCEQHNLKYVLFYGTLLGAVRHRGYIPWDDDIDIAMPRTDYEYFIRNFQNSRYGVKSCKTDKNYYLPWAKAYDKQTVKIEPVQTTGRFEIGFNIDIFPADLFSGPENYWRIKKKEYLDIRCLQNGLIYVEKIRNLKDLLKRAVQALFYRCANHYSKRIDCFFIKKDSKSAKKTCYVTNSVLVGVKTRRYIFPLNIFEERILADFEDSAFYIPASYHDVLVTCYGDYQVLPPINKRVTHHNFKAYFK